MTNVAIATNNTDKVDEADEEDLANDVNGANEAMNLTINLVGPTSLQLQPKAMMRPKAMMPLLLTFTPSRNILQLLQK